MKNTILLPHKFKKVGWLIFIPAFIFGLFIIFKGWEIKFLQTSIVSILPENLFAKGYFFNSIEVNLTNTIIGILIIIGGLLISFSKEKDEDEFINKLRLQSLLWAVLVNYSILIVAFIFIYETAFLQVMIYNMFTILLIFISRFNYLLYKSTSFKIND